MGSLESWDVCPARWGLQFSRVEWITALMSQNVIGFHYTLKNKAGEILDRTSDRPMAYLEGSGGIIEGLEESLSGMNAGEKDEVIVRPEKGYGFRDESQINTVSKSLLPADEVKVGDFFQAGGDQHAPRTYPTPPTASGAPSIPQPIYPLLFLQARQTCLT